MHKENASIADEGIEQAVDVGLALLAQLSEFPLQVLDKWRARPDISDSEETVLSDRGGERNPPGSLHHHRHRK